MNSSQKGPGVDKKYVSSSSLSTTLTSDAAVGEKKKQVCISHQTPIRLLIPYFNPFLICLQEKPNMRGVERSQLGAKKKVHFLSKLYFLRLKIITKKLVLESGGTGSSD